MSLSLSIEESQHLVNPSQRLEFQAYKVRIQPSFPIGVTSLSFGQVKESDPFGRIKGFQHFQVDSWTDLRSCHLPTPDANPGPYSRNRRLVEPKVRCARRKAGFL